MPEIKDSNQDYYTEKGRKISDFCIGFFGAWIATVILTSILLGLESIFFQITTIFDSVMPWITTLVSLFFYIFAIKASFKNGRRYIGIGLISAPLLPLLIFGACLLVLFGSVGF